MVGAASERELGDTNGVLVHIVDATTMNMTESLVPEGTEGITVKVIDKQDTFIGVIDTSTNGR